jgi:hypothetical protein
MIDTTGYAPSPLAVTDDHVGDLPREEANARLDAIVAGVPARRAQLADLCRRNGYPDDPAGWTRLITDHVAADPDDPNQLAPLWIGVGFDVALALSDELIRRGDGALTWSLNTATGSVTYQQPIVVGFRKVDNPRFHAEFHQYVEQFMLRVVQGTPGRALGAHLDSMVVFV